MEPSSNRPWQEQFAQHLKAGRLRYLQRIAVVCAALEPHDPPPPIPPLPTPPQSLTFTQSTTSLESNTHHSPEPTPSQSTSSQPSLLPTNNLFTNQDSIVHKHGRLYIPNPFLLPSLHPVVVGIRRRSFTLKRIIAALSAGDLSPLLDKEVSNDQAPLLPFLLSCVYVHLVQVKGDSALEIETTLQTVIQNKSLAKYSHSTPPVTHTELITAVLNRTLRFTEPAFSESPLSAFGNTPPLSLYFNELFESVFLERWTNLHNAKALIKSLQGAVEKSGVMEIKLGTDHKLPPATSQEAWNEHIETCFDLIYEYQYRSPSIVIAQLSHLYQLHHAVSLRKGPKGYLGWWGKERTRRLSLLVQILRHTTKNHNNINNIEITKFVFLLLVGWANQQQPHELAQRLKHKADKVVLDDEGAKLIVEATELAKSVLSMRDSNFAPSLVFLFLSPGILLSYSEQLGRSMIEYILGLLNDDLWCEFFTSQPRLSEILVPFAEFMAALRSPSELRAAAREMLVLWRSVVPTFNDGLLVHTVFKVAASNASLSGLDLQELEAWYSVVGSVIHEFFGPTPPHISDSVHFTSLYAASGILKGLPSNSHPTVHFMLQEVLMTALHRIYYRSHIMEVETTDVWKSAVAFALAHSGLCSKNTTLDVDNDVPKALELLVQVIVSDVFGGWIFGVPPFPSTNALDGQDTQLTQDTQKMQSTQHVHDGQSTEQSDPIYHPYHLVGLDIQLTPARAHAHAKTAHFASSSVFTSSIARLFTALPQNHPSRDTTVFYLWSYAKVVYDSWREFTHRTETSYKDSSVVTSSLLPIVQVAQLAITLFCFYASQVSSPPQPSIPSPHPTHSEVPTSPPSNQPSHSQPTNSGISPKHAVDAIDALSYLEFAGADVPRFYSKLANLFLYDPTTLAQNVKELIYRIPIPVSAYASFYPTSDTPQAPVLPPTKDGKALLARVAFLLRVVEPLAPLVDIDTLTNRLVPVAFALLSHASEQVRRSAHAVIHSLLALAPVPLAQSLVPSYCRIALASALVDDVPVPSASNNSQIADYLYESMAAIFRRMSPPVALIAVKALSSAAMNAVASSSDYGTQHKKLILLLLAQTVVQVDISILDITLAEISKVIHSATNEYKFTLLNFLHRVVTRNVDYTRKTHLASWFLLQVRDAQLED